MNNVNGINIPDFKTYYRAVVIKQSGIGSENRHVDQQNKTGNLNIGTHNYNQS